MDDTDVLREVRYDNAHKDQARQCHQKLPDENSLSQSLQRDGEVGSARGGQVLAMGFHDCFWQSPVDDQINTNICHSQSREISWRSSASSWTWRSATGFTWHRHRPAQSTYCIRLSWTYSKPSRCHSYALQLKFQVPKEVQYDTENAVANGMDIHNVIMTNPAGANVVLRSKMS